MNIVNLIDRLGADAINYQWLNQPGGALRAIRTDEQTGVSTVQFETKATTINAVAENRGPIGIILWVDREMLETLMRATNHGTT